MIIPDAFSRKAVAKIVFLFELKKHDKWISSRRIEFEID